MKCASERTMEMQREKPGLIGALKVILSCSAEQVLESRALPSRTAPYLSGDCEHWARQRKVKSGTEIAQSCRLFCGPMDCSLPGSSIHGIFQARILEWVAISFSRRSSWTRDRTWVSHIVGRRFTFWAIREVLNIEDTSNNFYHGRVVRKAFVLKARDYTHIIVRRNIKPWWRPYPNNSFLREYKEHFSSFGHNLFKNNQLVDEKNFTYHC